MNGYLRLLTGLVMAAGLTAGPASAQAPTWFGQAANGTWLVGGKVATVQNGFDHFGDAQTLTVMVGYEFTRPIADSGTVSVEFEAHGTANKGSQLDGTGEWKSSGLAGYLAYRTPGDIYFKAKLGLSNTRVTLTESGRKGADSRDTSFGYGVGLGMRLKRGANVEIEFTGNSASEPNDQSAISIGGHVPF